MKSLIFIFVFVYASLAKADGEIYLPNIPGYATGTQQGGHNGLDVQLIGGSLPGAVNQGSQGLITSPWWVEGTDGTNHASYTAGGSENVNITNSITTLNASVAPTGGAVPADATYLGANNSGNITGLLIGQQTMANSLACVLPSNQSAIPITVASLPLPVGAATSALQTTINTTLGSPFQAGGSIGNASFGATQATAANLNATVVGPAGVALAKDSSLITINSTLGSPFQAGGSIGNASFGISGTLPAFAAIPAFKIDQTTPGTTNGVQVNAALPAGGNTIGAVTQASGPWTENQTQVGGSAITLGSKTSANSYPVVIASDQGGVQIKSAINTNGSFTQYSITTGASTASVPANAVKVLVQNDNSSSDCMRFEVGGTASATVGFVLQPGQDTGQMDVSANLSIVACSSTQKANVQWILSQ